MHLINFCKNYGCCTTELKKIKIQNNGIEGNESLEKFTNQMINKITNNLEGFNYNVIIANIYETYNFINKIIEKDLDSKTLKIITKKY